MPTGRTGLRSKPESPAKSKGPTKKTVGSRKKPAADKKSSVTLTQMVGGSDRKRPQTKADAEYVCRYCYVRCISRCCSRLCEKFDWNVKLNLK